MNRNLVILPTVALAAAASAQSWEIHSSNPLVTPGQNWTTVTLSLDPGPGSDYIAGVNFSVHAEEDGWSDPIAIPATRSPPVPGQNPGIIDGASVRGISVGQLHLFGYTPEPGRIDLWQATFTTFDFTARTVDAWTETDRLDVYLSDWRREMRVPIEGRGVIIFIPAPATGVGLALAVAGNLVSRRRR